MDKMTVNSSKRLCGGLNGKSAPEKWLRSPNGSGLVSPKCAEWSKNTEKLQKVGYWCLEHTHAHQRSHLLVSLCAWSSCQSLPVGALQDGGPSKVILHKPCTLASAYQTMKHAVHDKNDWFSELALDRNGSLICQGLRLLSQLSHSKKTTYDYRLDIAKSIYSPSKMTTVMNKWICETPCGGLEVAQAGEAK